MPATNPINGTVWISGTDKNGTTRTVQVGSTTAGDDPPQSLVFPAVEWQFQNKFEDGLRYFRDTAEVTKNLQLLGWLRFNQVWLSTANVHKLELLIEANNQVSVELYLKATGTNTVIYWDAVTASKLNNVTQRIANKCRFADNGIVWDMIEPTDLTKWAVSFLLQEERG